MDISENALTDLLDNETATPLALDPEPWVSADGKRSATNARSRSTFFPGWDYEQDASKYAA